MNNTNKASTNQYADSDLRMYGIAEAAKILNVSPKLLRDKIRQGEIDTIRWGSSRRIPHWHLKKWQERELNSLSNTVEKILYPQTQE